MANRLDASGPVAAQPDSIAEARRRTIYYGYWLVGGAFIAQLASVGAQNYVIGSFLTPMTTDLGWSRSEFTLSRTIAQFLMAMTGFVIGAHVDRKGGRRLMLIGATIMFVALMLCAQVQTLWQWIAINGVLLTVGAAMCGNLVVNVTLSKWFVEKRGRVIAFSSMGVSFAGIVWPPLITAAIDGLGWRTAWRITAVVATLLLYGVALIMRRAPEDYGLHPDGRTDAQLAAGAGQAAAADFASSLTRHQAIRTLAFYLIVLSFGIGGLSISVMLIQTIPFMTDAGYSRATAAFMITLISIPALLVKPVWGYLIDKGRPRLLSQIGFVTVSLSLVLVVVSVAQQWTPLVYASFLLLGAGWGGFIPLQEVIWASFFGRRYLGAVRSAGLPVALVVQASGPLAVSFYFDRVGNYNGAFLTIAAMALGAAIMIQFARRPNRV